MALGKTRRHSKPFVPPKLQITSMMDMFTIILIFLLFSFSSKPETIDLDKNIKLPESVAELDHKESIKLVLSLTSLTLEDEIIANIKDGKIVGLDPLKLKESNLTITLVACLRIWTFSLSNHCATCLKTRFVW